MNSPKNFCSRSEGWLGSVFRDLAFFKCRVLSQMFSQRWVPHRPSPPPGNPTIIAKFGFPPFDPRLLPNADLATIIVHTPKHQDVENIRYPVCVHCQQSYSSAAERGEIQDRSLFPVSNPPYSHPFIEGAFR